jgi:peptide chain release factor 1
VELRAGEGGHDAILFCEELRAWVAAYARHRSDPAQIVPAPSGARTLMIRIDGDRAASERLAGVHRIQRVPKNDKRSRRHTSTATLAVLDRADTVPVSVVDDEIDVYTYVGTGKGGQHRKKTATAVRMVHRPTGIVVVVEHGRSQWQNLQNARAELTRRLVEQAEAKRLTAESTDRNQQIASSERPLKQYTHNEQRATVSAHELGVVWR